MADEINDLYMAVLIEGVNGLRKVADDLEVLAWMEKRVDDGYYFSIGSLRGQVSVGMSITGDVPWVMEEGADLVAALRKLREAEEEE